MSTVKLFPKDAEKWVWIRENCRDYDIVEYVIDPRLFERVPYLIRFNKDQEYMWFLLRWS